MKVRVSGPRRRLPAEIENNLLRIGQEALANAARHAHADEISIDLRFGERVVRLSVKDDGCGFDVEHAAQAASGHFGLAGIRERVHNLGGELNLLSRPGQYRDGRGGARLMTQHSASAAVRASASWSPTTIRWCARGSRR